MNTSGDSLIQVFLQYFFGQGLGFIGLITVIYLLVWQLGRKRFESYRIKTIRQTDWKQIKDELRHTCSTVAVAAVNATSITLLYESGYTKLSNASADWTTMEIAASAAGLIVFNDAWFYFWHRLLHHPRVFHRIHAVHHGSIDVNPFTSYSFHAVEALVISSWAIPAVIFVPFYIPVFGIVQTIGTGNNVMSHLGYEFLPRRLLRVPLLKWMNTATFHSLHHTEFNGNYGLFFRFWDRVLGTELSGYERAFRERSPDIVSQEQIATATPRNGGSMVVVFDEVEHVISLESCESILHASRRQGLRLPAGCERGVCGTCKIKVIRGKVDTPSSSCLTLEERGQRLALACVGIPEKGAVVEPLRKASSL